MAAFYIPDGRVFRIPGVTFQGKRAHASGGSRTYPSTSNPSLRIVWYITSRERLLFVTEQELPFYLVLAINFGDK